MKLAIKPADDTAGRRSEPTSAQLHEAEAELEKNYCSGTIGG